MHFINLSTYLFICLSVCVSLYLSVCLSISLYMCLSLSICLSICLSAMAFTLGSAVVTSGESRQAGKQAGAFVRQDFFRLPRPRPEQPRDTHARGQRVSYPSCVLCVHGFAAAFTASQRVNNNDEVKIYPAELIKWRNTSTGVKVMPGVPVSWDVTKFMVHLLICSSKPDR